MARPAAFIDRDGTLIEDADFLTSPDQIRFLPGAVPALKRLHEAGYAVVIVTNQSGVARGLLSEADLDAVHEALVRQVEMMGGYIDAIYYCPHLPPDHADAGDPGNIREFVAECDCRKPLPGMFLKARYDLGLDLETSFAVGDAWRDVEAALAVGVPSVKVPRPPARQERPRPELPIIGEAATLAEAAEMILNTSTEEVRQRVRQAQQSAVAETHNVESTTMAKRSRRKKKHTPEATLEFAAPEEPPAEPVPDAAAPDETAELQYDASLASSPVLERIGGGETAEELEYEPAEDVAEAEETLDEEEEDYEDEEDVEVDEEAFAEALHVETDDEEEDEEEELDEDEDEEEDEEEEDYEDDEDEEGEYEDAWECGRCGAEIEEADLTSGAAGEVHNVLLCRKCYPEVARMSERADRHMGQRTPEAASVAPGDAPATLDAILGELKIQSARQRPIEEGVDLPRVVGMVTQTLAIVLAGAAAVPVYAEHAAVLLLAAIFVQLLTLTMFSISRKRG